MILYKIIYLSFKIRQSDTKYQSLSHERLACQAYARDHRKISNWPVGKCVTVAKKLNKKYGNLTQVTKRIDYDLKHGVERQEVIAFLALIKTDQSYLELRQTIGFGDRLYSLESGFLNNDSKANHSLSFVDY